MTAGRLRPSLTCSPAPVSCTTSFPTFELPMTVCRATGSFQLYRLDRFPPLRTSRSLRRRCSLRLPISRLSAGAATEQDQPADCGVRRISAHMGGSGIAATFLPYYRLCVRHRPHRRCGPPPTLRRLWPHSKRPSKNSNLLCAALAGDGRYGHRCAPLLCVQGHEAIGTEADDEFPMPIFEQRPLTFECILRFEPHNADSPRSPAPDSTHSPRAT